MSTLAETRVVGRLPMSRVALYIILASETVFFGTLLVAYASLRDQLHRPIQHGPAYLLIPSVNTLLLLISVLSAWRATINIRAGRISALLFWLAITLTLGSIFVGGQIYEFSRSGMRVDDPALGGVFFALVGFHAIHVLAGMVILILDLVRTRLGDFSAARHDAVDLGAFFWYYVAAIWLVLFAALYLL